MSRSRRTLRRKAPSALSRQYVLRYLATRHHRLIVGAFFTLAGLALLIVRTVLATHQASANLVILGSASVFVGCITCSLALFRTWRDYETTKLTPRPFDRQQFEDLLATIELPKELKDCGYEVIRGGLAKGIFSADRVFTGASAASHAVNALLWDAPRSPDSLSALLPVRSQRTWLRRYHSFRIPLRSRSLVFPIIRQLNNRRLTNEDKIRLRKDLLTSPTLSPLVIERTDYIADLSTGQLTGVRFEEAQGSSFYNGLDFPFEYVRGAWTLKPSESSGCSNQIGGSALVIGVSWTFEYCESALFFTVPFLVQNRRN